MKLNWFEKMVMNSPVRPIMQRKEARLLLGMGGALEGKSVLEMGCGRGAGVDIIFNLFHPSYVEAFDFDPAQVRLAERRLSCKYRDRIKLYQASATKIPAEDGQFDAVFNFGALHHIPDNSLALNEISRVLKPGGKFYFTEILSSFTGRPMMRLLTDHPPEAQFTWDQLSEKISASNLAVLEHAFPMGSGRVAGVALKEGNGSAQVC